MKKATTVTILNRHYPPSAAITGKEAYKLSQSIISESRAKLTVVHVRAPYKGVRAESNTRDARLTIRTLPSLTTRSGTAARLLGSLFESLLLALTSIRSDVVVCMTDPPFMFLFISILRRVRRFKLVYWAMDLYPETFAAAGLLNSKALLFRLYSYLVKTAPIDMLIALGPEQEQYLLSSHRKVKESLIWPCGIPTRNLGMVEHQQPNPTPQWYSSEHLHIVYAGNLGFAHDDSLLYAVAEAIDPNKHRLILALYGEKSKEAHRRLQSMSGVVLVPFISPWEMDFTDLHLASLLPEWTHVCVPSKAVTSICSAKPILFCGSTAADAASFIGIKEMVVDPALSVAEKSSRVESILARLEQEKSPYQNNLVQVASRLHAYELSAMKRITNYIKNLCEVKK